MPLLRFENEGRPAAPAVMLLNEPENEVSSRSTSPYGSLHEDENDTSFTAVGSCGSRREIFEKICFTHSPRTENQK